MTSSSARRISVEHVTYLVLRKTFGIKDTSQTVAFFLLVAQYGQNTRMEVAVTVTWNAELKPLSLAVAMARTVSVTLIARILSQKLTAFSEHQALEHDLH